MKFGIVRGSLHCAEYLTKGRAASTWGATWKSPRLAIPRLLAPPSRIIGQQFASALPRALIALVMPGPETTSAAEMRPLMYDTACAANAAACSCRTPT